MLAICIDTKAIGITIAFTALATALNFIRIPVPYMPTFYYQMGDVALVIAFLLFGLRIGLTVAALNMVVTMTIFYSPGGLVGPPYYLVSVLTTVLGVCLFEKLVKPKISQSKAYHGAKPAVLCTICGVLTRTLLMFPLDYGVFGFLVSIVSGLSIPAAYAIVLASMPGIILYNITVPIYVIPTSYYIATQVSKHSGNLLQTPSNRKAEESNSCLL